LDDAAKTTSRHRPIVLLELTSTKGKTLNDNSVTITGQRDPKTHRYPIVFENWLTGESETLTIKICNLNPTTNYKFDTEKKKDYRNLVEYTSNGNLKKSHGLCLHAMLMCARWETNKINGNMYEGDHADFIRLPRENPILTQLNANMWTWRTVAPKIAGIHGRGRIADLVCHALMNDDDSSEQAQTDKPWPLDGPNGIHLARNMVRAMKDWAVHRVTDMFLVSHKFKTGSIMTTFHQDGRLGQVYLVKGYGTAIAEMGPELPFCCRTTLLPIYDCWAYDGYLTMGAPNISPKLKRALQAHVRKAIIEEKVSWRGPNAEKWEYPPPQFPKVNSDSNDELELDWSAYDIDPSSNLDTNNATEEKEETITSEHRAIGRKIVQASLQKGGLDYSSPTNGWAIRRIGYSYQDNPNGIAMVMSEGMPVISMKFKVDCDRSSDPSYIPTYKLKELLNGILKAAKMVSIPPLILADELAVVSPLQTILTECFEEKGATVPNVLWVSC